MAAFADDIAGKRYTGKIKDDAGAGYKFLSSSEDLVDLKRRISTLRLVQMSKKKMAASKTLSDPIVGGALDSLDWSKYRVVVVVGGSPLSAEYDDGKLKVAVEAATEGSDVAYEALVVASAATECEWDGPDASSGSIFKGDVMQRPLDRYFPDE